MHKHLLFLFSLLLSLSLEAQCDDFSLAMSSTDVSCNAGCDGTATAAPQGGTGPYSFQWSTGQSMDQATLTGLCAGNYQVTVTDGNNCELIGEVEVSEPIALTVGGTVVDEMCFEDCEGRITLSSVSGGLAPYTYQWSQGATTSMLTNLCGGVYTVTVTDDNGCTAVEDFTVSSLGTFDINVVRTGGECSDTPDVLPRTVLEVTGEGQPFNFAWSNGSTGDTIPRGAALERYSVTVTSADGCPRVEDGLTWEAVVSDPGGNFQSVFVAPCESWTDAVVDRFAYEDGRIAVSSNGDTVAFSDLVDSPIPEARYRLISVSPGGTCFDESLVLIRPFSASESAALSFTPDNGCGALGELTVDIDYTLFGPDDLYQGAITGPGGFFFDLEMFSFGESTLFNDFDPGTYTLTVSDGCDEVVRTVNISDDCGTVSGTVFLTDNTTCTPGPDDLPVPQMLLQLVDQGSDAIYYTISDETGGYSIILPTGNYQAIPTFIGEPVAGDCGSPLFSISDDAITSLDVLLPNLLPCPQMEVNLAIEQQRRCFENSLSIGYSNSGQSTAVGAEITLEVDEFYTGITSDVSFTQQGQTLTFAIGDVPPYGTGTIRVFYTISCNAELGETHCNTASITPAGYCEPNPNWNGSLVNITSAVCDGDSVRFTVTNIGDNTMTVPLSYVVVEDGIMMTSEPIEVEPLEASESIEVAVAAATGMYHLITNQEPFAPTTSTPTLLVDACSGTVVNDLTNIVALGNGVPWESTICRENTGSYDPNDKIGYPTGHTGNMIAHGTRLNYNIRFQNTGTDTAFTVVIRDTLEKSLDLSTFRIGASSHRYRMTIDTNRALTFTFDNIELPDSTTDLAGSQGMISFSIDHDPSLQPGDLIENQAAIYFDFNEPIITNLSVHMIEIMGLPTSLRPLLARSTDIKVFPNPVTDLLSIRIPDSAAERGDAFVITDLFGRDLGRLPSIRRDEGIQVGNLPNGFYYLTLVNEAGQAKGRTGFVVAR